MNRLSAFASKRATKVFPANFKSLSRSKIDERADVDAPANTAEATSFNKVVEEGEQHQSEGHEGVNPYDVAFAIENAKDLEIQDELTPNFLVAFDLIHEDRTSKYH